MLTQERLKDVLLYDSDIGLFYWKRNVGRAKKGDVAGCKKDNGYIQVSIDMKRYFCHRLAFLYMVGYFPEHQVDHLNGIRDDNSWCNLRHVTKSCNMQNQKVNKKNKSGFPGVSFFKPVQMWSAYIGIRGKRETLGYYTTSIDAALARLTEELWNENWTCNIRSELVKAIKKEWPDFNMRCVL